MTRFSRRALLGTALLLPLAGCAAVDGAARPSPSPSSTTGLDPDFAALEGTHDARIGVHAFQPVTGITVSYRADERFAFCSTFKAMAAAAVLDRSAADLDLRITYGRDELKGNAPITEKNVDTGLTLRELCDAAVRYSDGPAGNLLVKHLGGSAELTAWMRSHGDDTFRMDRLEPDITEATPGDPRDTTTPRAYATSLERIVLGDTLRPDAAQHLADLMLRNTTGAERMRAGAPDRWLIAERTGTGDYGTANDIGVLWPTKSSPIVLAIMSSRPEKDDEPSSALVAAAAALTLGAF